MVLVRATVGLKVFSIKVCLDLENFAARAIIKARNLTLAVILEQRLAFVWSHLFFMADLKILEVPF